MLIAKLRLLSRRLMVGLAEGGGAAGDEAAVAGADRGRLPAAGDAAVGGEAAFWQNSSSSCE